MDLLNKSGLQIRDLFLQGKISALEIVEFFLHRIDTLDSKTKAFLEVFHKEAKTKAVNLDQKRKENKALGKLAGIPIAIKDNIHIKGKKTTCGSKFLENYIAPFDATVTRLLEMEDAILIGKTNLDEFAMGSSTENSAYFPSHNPWNLACSPGGSSGGSAAAVAARLVPIALGTDTGGSIRQPASFCGLVGFKPTYGRVSRYGLVAFGSSLDQIGPFSINCEDSALLMEVLGQHCSHDFTSAMKPADDHLVHLKKDLKNLTIGIPRKFIQKHTPNNIKNFEETIQQLEKLGATVLEVDLSILDASIETYYILATAEASTNLARFDGVRYGVRAQTDNLRDLYFESRKNGFGSEVKRRILLGTYVLSAGYQEAYYRKAQKVRTLISNAFKKAFKACDVITLPTTPGSAFALNSIQDPLQMYLQDIYTIGSNLAGLPTMSLPTGFDEKQMPLSIQLVAPQFHDTNIFQVAHALESQISFHQHVPEHFGRKSV